MVARCTLVAGLLVVSRALRALSFVALLLMDEIFRSAEEVVRSVVDFGLVSELLGVRACESVLVLGLLVMREMLCSALRII